MIGILVINSIIYLNFFSNDWITLVFNGFNFNSQLLTFMNNCELGDGNCPLIVP
jgi:hypothetical protein